MSSALSLAEATTGTGWCEGCMSIDKACVKYDDGMQMCLKRGGHEDKQNQRQIRVLFCSNCTAGLLRLVLSRLVLVLSCL